MIEKYLISTCLFIIDEFNERYENESKDQLKLIADEEYSEADLVVRLGYPFKNMATFNMQGISKNKGNDIVVKKKDFLIEVKLLRNWRSGSGNANSMQWEPIQKDFNWIADEIKKGNQGSRAFVIGWFNAVDRLSQIVQLGKGSGRFPEIDREKTDYFPFIGWKGSKTIDTYYNYTKAYKELPLSIPGFADGGINCMFFGSETDKFHIAVYW